MQEYLDLLQRVKDTGKQKETEQEQEPYLFLATKCASI